MEAPFYICSCFFSRNIYLQKYTLHVNYTTDDRFFSDYSQELISRGCPKESLPDVLKQVHAEISRRQQRGKEHCDRRDNVASHYQRLHHDLYVLKESMLDPEFLKIIEYCRSPSATVDGLVPLLTKESAPDVYSFPVLSEGFCERFIEELEHFQSSGMTPGRPNTMNKSGLLLNELGFDEGFTNPLRSNYLQFISKLLYPECVGNGLDSQRAHVVNYCAEESKGKDIGLSSHYDNAEVTLNVSLGKDFTDGELYFTDNEVPVGASPKVYICNHKVGRGIIHRGSHIHGALDVGTGERYNLIVWMRSSSVRNKLCPRCKEVPKLIPFTGYGDGFVVK